MPELEAAAATVLRTLGSLVLFAQIKKNTCVKLMFFLLQSVNKRRNHYAKIFGLVMKVIEPLQLGM